jgi:hypothetical protein
VRNGSSHRRSRVAVVLIIAVGAFYGLTASASAVPIPCDLNCPDPGTTTYNLHVDVSGGGVVKQGTTTLCGSSATSCDFDVAEGSDVTLTAAPNTGITFDGWTGSCSGTGDCTFTMTGPKSVTAFFADHTPPGAPTISSPTTNQVIQSTTGGATSVAFAGDGTTTSYRCRMDVNDSSGASTCSSSWSTGSLSTGTHTAYVWALDSAGNVSAAASRAFKVVNLPDTTLSGTPAAGVLTNATSTAFGYSSPTGTTYMCTLDGSDVPCTANVGPLTQGAHTFSVKAGISPFGDNVVYYDASPATRTFTVDSVAPTVSISSGPTEGSATSDPSATFGFSGSDPAPGTPLTYECSLDGAAFGACPASYSGLAVGAHSFRVRAIDTAGNASSAAERHWTVIADADGDGFFTNSDCDDTSASIHPGATEVAGNGIDEDCSGADAVAPSTVGGTSQPGGSDGGGGATNTPPAATAVVAARLARSFKVSKKGALVKTLKLSGVTPGSTVTLACKGKGCAFKSKRAALKNGGATLQALFKKRLLKPGAVVTITVTHAGMSSRQFKLTVKKIGQPALKAL